MVIQGVILCYVIVLVISRCGGSLARPQPCDFTFLTMACDSALRSLIILTYLELKNETSENVMFLTSASVLLVRLQMPKIVDLK